MNRREGYPFGSELSEGWQIRGWRPHAWRLAHSMEIGFSLLPDIPPIPAVVPGSVQGALLRAGLLPDWQQGTNSRACEWVEHLHWEFFTEIPFPEGVEDFRLDAEWLDHAGWLLVDGHVAAEWEGSMVRHTFRLDGRTLAGKMVRLSFVFDGPPAEQGQVGFTSLSHHFKPRFSYGWDWCPRFVPMGFGSPPRIIFSIPAEEVQSVRTECLSDRGCVVIRSNVTQGMVRLSSPSGEVIERDFQSKDGEVVVEIEKPQRWWPNGLGPPGLYHTEIFDGGGRCVWNGSLGFKEIRWLQCEGAPESAEPWICEVNGHPVFLQGVNWTPASLNYLETNPDDIQCLIDLYKEMGCNLLRVWGGAFLESDIFYRAADRAGLMVWQEFPLSSSGIDNWPPEEEETIQKLELIATDFVRRRCHHPSLLLWCGGNELQAGVGSKIGIGRPVDMTHPCLSRLGEVVAREAPNIRFLPTSASGPRFTAGAGEFGLGLHHDVHGPWNLETDLDAWRCYWENDDALFRSETGMPGTMTAEQVRAYAGELNPWPPDENNLLWLHVSSWWRQLAEFEGQVPESKRSLETYCQWSREQQAEALGIAAAACKNRFPRCGGFLVWMGHDCHPCPANTSIIDIERFPKPAFQKLKSVFKGDRGAT